MGFKQGYYQLKHPEKYLGDPNKVRYMSSWELHTHEFLDNDPRVIKWGAEIVPIKYLKPTDKRVHTYYPDYYVKYKDRKGRIRQEIIEVKPKRQVQKPRSRTSRVRLYEDITYAINISKWKHAEQWCKKRGITFRILTEDNIFV